MTLVANRPKAPSSLLGNPEGPQGAARLAEEVTAIHTRIMRLGLAAEDSRAYWVHADPTATPAARIERAFAERWFGSRSLQRVHYLVNNLDFRFLPFPGALQALRDWAPRDPADRRLVCHWHVQLTDPLYRAFAGEYLPQRRLHPQPTVDADGVVRWLNQRMGTRWNPGSTRRVATGLLSTAHETGLCGPGLNDRPVLLPPVPDAALAYLLYLLRTTPFAGTIIDNPYLASVGLDPESAKVRLRRGLPGIAYRHVGDVHEFEWAYASLTDWAHAQEAP